MEAIFLACGAGGPQLKRNPLGGGTMWRAVLIRWPLTALAFGACATTRRPSCTAPTQQRFVALDDSTTPGTITGYVWSLHDSASIPYVRVWVNQAPAAVADTSGRFQLTGLRPGRVQLKIHSIGYRAAELSVNVPDRQGLLVRGALERDCSPSLSRNQAIPKPPPNMRLKLSARGGRLIGNWSVLSAAAAGRSLSATR